jgi:hypothetical protein
LEVLQNTEENHEKLQTEKKSTVVEKKGKNIYREGKDGRKKHEIR